MIISLISYCLLSLKMRIEMSFNNLLKCESPPKFFSIFGEIKKENSTMR